MLGDMIMKFTASEKKIIKKVREFTKNINTVYNFWFIYDIGGNAVNFEGGWELSDTTSFRNDFSLAPGKYQRITRTAIK